MAEAKLPYVVGTGSLTKALEKIQSAATPDRFTQDFLATKLALKGGSPKAVIPFFKRTGFLGSDGTPTDLYRRFRNKQERGVAAAEALRTGYAMLFEANEYAQDLDDEELRGLIVQMTGVEKGSRVLTATLASFKALAEYAVFDPAEEVQKHVNSQLDEGDDIDRTEPPADINYGGLPNGLNLGYTINLHLPATSDIAVFNAIFKSLRDNLLR